MESAGENQKYVEALQKLSEGMRQIREGNLSYRIKYSENNDLYEIYEDFNEMVTETQRLSVKASKIDQGRKELLMDISHDIRSPLTAIIAYVQGLLDGVAQTPEAQRRYLSTIEEKSIDVKKMVDRLFLYAKLDNTTYLGEPEKLSVNDEIRELLAVIVPEYAARGLSITLQEKGSGFIYADSDIFRRVCINLIENSCKYRDKPEGHMQIQIKEERRNMRITFHDDGPGISPSTLPHIWDVFYRGDKSRSNPHQGSGIGLAIVKKAVDNMNGKIVARNDDGNGLVISIRIPKMEDTYGENINNRR